MVQRWKKDTFAPGKAVKLIQLNKSLLARFPAWLAPNYDITTGRARSLSNCISVKDGIKTNEQNNPIAKGPLYVQTKIGAI